MNCRRWMKDELIGLEFEVLESDNKQLIGIKGKIIDETKNTITIQSQEKKIRKFIKKDIIFAIQNKGEKQIIIGSKITFRPEERVKRI
ncbi:MAG: ribonuclease P protein subunit [Nanoarchaeota archaeon]|nr:ribonuclease P protein subunit [Nanoarchaeota archaeon]MCK5629287.1 ribonuclease P protein subunit [Nanoarchaeota archaeon]